MSNIKDEEEKKALTKIVNKAIANGWEFIPKELSGAELNIAGRNGNFGLIVFIFKDFEVHAHKEEDTFLSKSFAKAFFGKEWKKQLAQLKLEKDAIKYLLKTL